MKREIAGGEQKEKVLNSWLVNVSAFNKLIEI
jgi:hypothetical protein